MSKQGSDLGFTYTITKTGDLRISHHGSVVTVVRGKQAYQFGSRLAAQTIAEQQQTLARLTGQYKRGNER